MKTIGEFLINILINILVIIGVLLVLVTSIPLLIIYTVATLIWRVAEFISTITKSVWEYLLDKYKAFLDVIKE